MRLLGRVQDWVLPCCAFARSWQKISESVLPGWDEQQLKLCTSRLLGTESLDRYTGWKGDAKVGKECA